MTNESNPKKSRQIRVLTFTLIMVVIIAIIAVTSAWLFENKGLQTMTKVQFPHLYLYDKQTQDSMPVELGEIDVRKAGEKEVPFYVDISKDASFILQLGHTTNLPLNYKIVEVKDDNTDGVLVTGKYLNITEGDTIANDKKHVNTYEKYEKDKVQKNAEPLYWQSDLITYTKKERKYILIVSWSKCDNTVIDKDTEMIYITAGIPGGNNETK